MEIGGQVEDGFEPVRAAFEENFAQRGELGATCAAYVDGRLVVDLWGGTTAREGGSAYGPDTLQLVASATKGAMAICVLRLAESGRIDLEAPMAEYWPEFAANGKGRVTVRQALAHQAGVPTIAGGITLADVVAWDPAAAALAAQAPVWEPGTAHGYHAITHAWLVGELVRRVDGRSPGTFFAEEVAAPLGLDLYVGLPESEHHRVAPMHPFAPPAGAAPDPFTLRMLDPDSLAHAAFFLSDGLLGWINDPRLWAAELPSGNGIGTARGLARLYAACLGEVDGVRLLSPQTVAQVLTPDAEGEDRVTGYETRYRLGFQLPFPFRPMSGDGAFGHYGLGGSVGFADTRRGLALGYAVNQMGPATPADARSVALVEALVGCLP
jgi:CubicO group peptidase (beta-lactamase class C family)